MARIIGACSRGACSKYRKPARIAPENIFAQPLWDRRRPFPEEYGRDNGKKRRGIGKEGCGSAEHGYEKATQGRPDSAGHVKGDTIQRNGRGDPRFGDHVLHSRLPGRKADSAAEPQTKSQGEQDPRRGEPEK